MTATSIATDRFSDSGNDSAREIHITRLYDAPVQAVWDAWTDPVQVAQWWGPRGFSITTHAKELRAGGTWEYTMHGPDGKDWPNFTRYHEVVPQSRLVYDHGATSADAEVFIINRSFDAPIDPMWEMWTTPEHFAKWLPPTGFTMEFRTADLRAGGYSVYSMTNGAFTMYGRAEYDVVQRPDRIEYTQVFTDEHGNITRHPAMPTWPAKMRTKVTLAAEGAAATRVTIRWAVEGDATREEMATFVNGRAGMTMGWTGSFDKLEAVLASA